MTAIELLNKYLPIFGKSGEYLKLIGDFDGKKMTLFGDDLLQIKKINLIGVTNGQLTGGKIFWTLIKTGSFVRLQIIGIPGILAEAELLPDSGTDVVIQERNSSGVTGLFTYAWVQNELSDPTNYIKWGRGEVDGIVKINDLNEGAIANGVEYIRKMIQYLLKQLNINTATDDWLDYIFTDFFAISRKAGETDANYIIRVKKEILSIRVTPQRIRLALEDYGDNVQIIEGGVGGAFSDVSFANNYKDFALIGEKVVKNATTFMRGLLVFYFKVIMDNVDPNDYIRISQLIKDYKSAGISYDIQINL